VLAGTREKEKGSSYQAPSEGLAPVWTSFIQTHRPFPLKFNHHFTGQSSPACGRPQARPDADKSIGPSSYFGASLGPIWHRGSSPAATAVGSRAGGLPLRKFIGPQLPMPMRVIFFPFPFPSFSLGACFDPTCPCRFLPDLIPFFRCLFSLASHLQVPSVPRSPRGEARAQLGRDTRTGNTPSASSSLTLQMQVC
jgi:hypothetical protein